MAGVKRYDDVNLDDEYWNQGDPIRFTNPEIRKMLTLAGAGKDDVFCDFGSGFGQNIVIALTEFRVKRAIGVEVDETRAWRSVDRLEDLGLDKRGKIVIGPFEDLADSALRNVTILFYGLSGGKELVSRLQHLWTAGRIRHRLVWNDWHPIPEAFPDEADYPFYVSYFPQTRTNFTQRAWLERVVLQPGGPHSNRSLDDLWDEFAHNMDVLQFRDDVSEYKERLRKVARGALS